MCGKAFWRPTLLTVVVLIEYLCMVHQHNSKAKVINKGVGELD